jgi:hypothetical protein
MNENTEVFRLDADALELRYYDDGRPGTYRCWRIPLHEARDIAGWWTETGSHVVPGRPLPDAQRVGSVLACFMSPTQIHALGCDQRGRSNITGYQLPREAVAFLNVWLDQNPAAKPHAGISVADSSAPTAA